MKLISFDELVTGTLTRKRVSWRRYGVNGEKRRAMVHRFDIPGGDTIVDVMKENVVKTSPLLAQLMKRGR